LANTVSFTSTSWKVLKRKTFVVTNPECEDPAGHTFVRKYGERTKRCQIEIVDGAGDLLVYSTSWSGPANVHDAGGWASHYVEFDEWSPDTSKKIPVRSGLTARGNVWNSSYSRIKSIQVDLVPGKNDLKAILEYETPGLYPHDFTLFASQLADSAGQE